MQLQEIDDYDISIISDPHVLSFDLIADTEDFKKEIKIDRKLMVESEALFKEALSLVDKANSEFLFIPGDLVKDGEYKSHQVVKENLLAWKNKDEKREVFLIPGNHDLNNHKSHDFKKDKPTKNINPREFLDLYDFVFKNPYILEMYKDSDIFKIYLDEVNKKYDRKEEFSYYAHGYFSYVARIPSNRNDSTGLTLISIDTSIYSADTEQNHRDQRENVAGSITLSQMKWIVEKIDQAKARKDLIFVMAHHAIMPNFRNQELVFSPFIIKEWRSKYVDDNPKINGKTPIEVLADNGVKFVFTGHLHENGTAKYTSEIGNVIYDIQTGSPITYPLPIRHIKVVNRVAEENGYEVYIKTELIKEFTYKNLDDEIEVVYDAINYTINKQLSLRDVLHNYIRIQVNSPKFEHLNLKNEISNQISSRLNIKIPEKGYVNELLFPMVEKFLPIYKKHIGNIYLRKIDGEYQLVVEKSKNYFIIKASKLEEAINIILDQIQDKILTPYKIVRYWDKNINKGLDMPIDEYGHKLYDFANYLYQYKPLGEDQRPDFVNKMIDNLNDPSYDIINLLLDYMKDDINESFDKLASLVKFEKNNSKDLFFDDLAEIRGLWFKLAYKYLKFKVNTLRDLLDFFSMNITKEKKISGVDLAKTIVRSKSLIKAKESFSTTMFGQASLRKFVIDMVNSMSDEMVEIYQNEDTNELEKYFNYVEYDDYNK